MILDCFPFFNELDLLEVRLHTLAPYVDAFVLCEANRTFQGAEKPFVFEKHRGESRFRSKPIVSIQLDLSGMDGTPDPWAREQVQRKALRYAFDTVKYATDGIRRQISPSDRLILSDIDEIPDLKIFETFDFSESSTMMAWHQMLYYYWVNMRCWDWIGPVSCTLETFQSRYKSDMQLLRDSRAQAQCVLDGGWHFSFLGGPQAIKEKIEAFSHTEYSHCAANEVIEYALREGWRKDRDLFGRDMMHFEVMPDDSHLPAYLAKNKERFSNWWYKSEQ